MKAKDLIYKIYLNIGGHEVFIGYLAANHAGFLKRKKIADLNGENQRYFLNVHKWYAFQRFCQSIQRPDIARLYKQAGKQEKK